MNKYVVGKCNTMCPYDEMIMRQKEQLLHLFEMVPGTEKSNPVADPNRAVKMYNRSAAGKYMTNEKYLRPPEVLLKTMKYLLANVAADERYTWVTKYDFISDRLRSVRQDMIIQNISEDMAIQLIEPMVRYYAFSSYWLCDQDIRNFDQHLNKKTLQECLNHLLVLYDQVEIHPSHYERKFLNHVDGSRPFFEVLNYILNLGNEEILLRLICLAKKWRTPLVDTVITMGIHYCRRNFVKVFCYMKDLSPIIMGVCILQLPKIRRKIFEIMSAAYSSKNLRFPSSELKQLFMYESEKDVIKDCTHYGLEARDDFIHFEKNSFNNSAEEVQPKKVRRLETYFKNVNDSTFFSGDDMALMINGMDLLKL